MDAVPEENEPTVGRRRVLTSAVGAGVASAGVQGVGATSQTESGEDPGPTFRATGDGGFISFTGGDEETARDNAIDFPSTGLDESTFEFQGDVDETDGSWVSVETQFPIVPVTDNHALDIEARDGLEGTLFPDEEEMTLSGELTVTFVDPDSLEPLEDTDSISFDIEVVTGESGDLTGEATFEDDTASVTLVDNELVIEDQTGDMLIDNLIGLPSTEPGGIWLELGFDLTGLGDLAIQSPDDDDDGLGIMTLALAGGIGLLALVGGYMLWQQQTDDGGTTGGHRPSPQTGHQGEARPPPNQQTVSESGAPGNHDGTGRPSEHGGGDPANHHTPGQAGTHYGQAGAEHSQPGTSHGQAGTQHTNVQGDPARATHGQGEQSPQQPDHRGPQDQRQPGQADTRRGEGTQQPPGGTDHGGPPTGGETIVGAVDGSDGGIEDRLAAIESLLETARDHRDTREYDSAHDTARQAVNEAETLQGAVPSDRTDEVAALAATAEELLEAIQAERGTYEAAWNRMDELMAAFDALEEGSRPDSADIGDVSDIRDELQPLETRISAYEFEALQSQIDQLRDACESQATESAGDDPTPYEQAIEKLDAIEETLDTAEERFEEGALEEARERLAKVHPDLQETIALVEDYRSPGVDVKIENRRKRWQQLTEAVEDALNTGEPNQIPSVPHLTLTYDDIEHRADIGTGANAKVYRAVVRDGDDEIPIAVKEPRVPETVEEESIEEISGSLETTALDVDDDEHEPGSSGTRIFYDDDDFETAGPPGEFDPVDTDPVPAKGSPTDRDEGVSSTDVPAEDEDNPDESIQGGVTSDLLAEAARWQRLDDHDHIVGVVDYGANPHPWIAMEYMDAGHLGERAGDLDFEGCLWAAIATTTAVDHAHQQGIAHLDLKPKNILFRSADNAWDVPKVADWGLSRYLLDHSDSAAGLSTHHAAPEQFDDSFGPADEQTDIYQLGTVLYVLFTGQKPFEGHPAQVMNAVLNNEIVPPGDVADLPSELDEILLKALALEKADRYETAGELLADLEVLRDSL